MALTAMPDRWPLLRSAANPYNRGMLGFPKESDVSATGLRQLLAGMRPELTRFMLARKCDPADIDDLLQDLFVKLASSHTGPVSNPRAYLYQMANNLLHDQRRGRRRQEDRDDHWARNRFGQDLERDPDPSPEQTAIDRDELVRVERVLAELPTRTAEIIRLYRVEGQTQKTIAAGLGISLSAVEKHLQRAYRALLQIRQELDFERECDALEADNVPDV